MGLELNGEACASPFLWEIFLSPANCEAGFSTLPPHKNAVYAEFFFCVVGGFALSVCFGGRFFSVWRVSQGVDGFEVIPSPGIIRIGPANYENSLGEDFGFFLHACEGGGEFESRNSGEGSEFSEGCFGFVEEGFENGLDR